MMEHKGRELELVYSLSMTNGIPSRLVLLCGSNFDSLEQHSLASMVCRLSLGCGVGGWFLVTWD